MKKRIIIYIVAAIALLISSHSYSQVRELSIGDTVPTAHLYNTVNFKTEMVTLSEFRGKLLILDFWATWCSPCIAMFSKTDALQKNFEGKVQFMPVTYQKSEEVGSFLKKMSNTGHIAPPSIVADTILSTMFKYSSMPHFVWISEKGVVIAITGSTDITFQNIQKMLSGTYPLLALKKDNKRSVDWEEPVFLTGYYSSAYGMDTQTTFSKINSKNLLFHSIMTGYINGLSDDSTNLSQYSILQGGGHYDSTRYTIINCSVALLLKNFFGTWPKYGGRGTTFTEGGRTIFEIKDTLLYYKLTGGYLNDLNTPYDEEIWKEWIRTNTICYEMILPTSITVKSRNDLIKQDLDRYLGNIYHIQFGIEKRLVKSWVLKRISNENSFASKGGNPFLKREAFSITLRNKSFGDLMGCLSYFFQKSNIVLKDETGYKGKVDIDLNCEMNNMNALNNELHKYGLEFKNENKIMDILVIKDKIVKQ